METLDDTARGPDRRILALARAPELAGRYELGPLLGRGTIGHVHQAIRCIDRRAVAIKFLMRLDDRPVVVRFLRGSPTVIRPTRNGPGSR